MTQMTASQAITLALAQAMRSDERVLLLGEGVSVNYRELSGEFGPERVRNTPLAEGIVAGTAVGASATGLRPVADLLFVPFLTYAMDEIVNSARKLRYLSGGQFSFPLVVLAKTGGGWRLGAQHNHNLEAWFVHSPGLKVVMPSTPADFKGLLTAAIEDNNPVLFFADVALLQALGEVPDEYYSVPLGEAAIRRTGSDLTLVAYAKAVDACMTAAEELALAGIEAEVIDLRTLKPIDEGAVLRSVQKTGRLIVIHEASGLCGIAAEIAALVAQQAHNSLRAPVVRLTGPDAPAGASALLEDAFAPDAKRISTAARALLRGASGAENTPRRAESRTKPHHGWLHH